MSRHTLDLTRSAQIVWRHKLIVGAITVLGLVGNAAYAMAQQPVFTSSAFAVLSPSVKVPTQIVVVRSVPVLSSALRGADLGLSLQALQRLIRVSPASAYMIAITAHGDTAARAERTANAVARSYIAYVTSPGSSVGRQPAQLLQPADTATAKPRTTRVLEAAGIGALLGALIAVIAALAIWRDEPWLRERDAIADSIGVPVLASVGASCPADVSGWTKLLDHYEPETVDAYLLRNVLRDLRAEGSSISVLSLSTDRCALALGPQLAVFAARQGIPTALVVALRRAGKNMTALHDACGAPSARAVKNLRVIASDPDSAVQLPTGVLTFSVAVVDAEMPRVAETARAALTVLSVTAGAVTAGQLNRIAASAASDGRDIAGILVANPVRADQTTGRVPQLTRSEQDRMPTRMVGVVTESRR